MKVRASAKNKEQGGGVRQAKETPAINPRTPPNMPRSPGAVSTVTLDFLLLKPILRDFKTPYNRNLPRIQKVSTWQILKRVVKLCKAKEG